MPLSNTQLSVIGGVFAVCLVGVAGFWLLDKQRSVFHGESHGTARTRMDIENLSLAIQIYIQETGKLPDAPSPSAKGALDTKHLYETLFGVTAAKLGIGPPATHWQESKELVDRWGNPLNMAVQSNGEASFRIRIWSSGPNGKNESGTGDDITSDDLRVEVRGEKN